METDRKKIPDTTIKTLARSFFKEASTYGFDQADYVRFVNTLLDQAMARGRMRGEDAKRHSAGQASSPAVVTDLPLRGEHVIIRAFDGKKDGEIVRSWLDDESGRHFLLSRTDAKHISLEDILSQESNLLCMITLHDGTPVGTVAFLDHDRIQEKAELRKLIGDRSMRGKGYGKEATALWIAYGFSRLGLKKIYLNTFDTNLRNIKLNEELGFRVEGILHNEVRVRGEYRDVLRMGLWRE